MTDESAVQRTVSAVSGVSAASDGTAAAVNESLEGLVSAVDELKKSMGMENNQVDFAAVEQFVQRLRQENEEFRQFAEEAILSAQRLLDERNELQSKLDQVSLEATMGAALAETQKLKDVADEFERDLYEKKLAEAEAKGAEVEALKEHILELEDENAGLTQTLNEFRATTQQLQRLQSHEVRRLQKVEAAGVVANATAVMGSGKTPRPGSIAEGGEPYLNGSAATGSASGGSSPNAASSTGGGAAPGQSPGTSSRGSAAPPPPPPAAAVAPSAQGVLAVAIAEQLEEVADGANSGLLAEAAVALRALSRRDAALHEAEKENARLRTEVDDLNDTMFSKTFKPPSAWAEREIKYKTEKKYWEEQQKELAARLLALSLEMEAYRGNSKAHQMEERIQDLEALLLQSEREKDSARAQLHELQLSMRKEGEFGAGGKRLSPYKGPLGVAAGEGHEVQQMVDHLEHGSIGIESPEVARMTAVGGRLHGLQAQLAQASNENQHLRRQLHEQQMVSVPKSLQGELGHVASAAAVMAAATDLEAKLAATEAQSQTLRQQLVSGWARAQQQGKGVSVGEGSAEAAAVAEEVEQQARDLDAQAQQAEAAGDNEEAASLRQQAEQLQQLAQRLWAAEEEKAALWAQLADLAPVRLHITAAAAAPAAEGGDQPAEAAVAAAVAEEVTVPTALQAELGTTAPAAVVAAKAAELEARLGEAVAEADELQQQMKLTMALQQQVRQAAAVQQEVQAKLAAAEDGSFAAQGNKEDLEQLRQQLEATQCQKEMALRQLWQLTELQEQLQKVEADHRRLAAQLQAARPVKLQLAVAAVAAGATAGDEEEPVAKELQLQALPDEEEEEPAELAHLCAELAAAQQHSSELRSQLQALQPAVATAAAPVMLALRVGGDGKAAERLAAAEAEAARLHSQLGDLQPVRLQLSLAAVNGGNGSHMGRASPGGGVAGSAAISPLPLLTSNPGELELAREASNVSLHSLMHYSSEQATVLSQERAAAEAALCEYQKSTDVPSLLHAKAELETRCEMLEAQLAKMQGELENADETNAVMENHLNSAIRTGDVSGLSGLKETLGGEQRQSLSKRMFKRKGKASPSKDTLKNTVHEMQDALSSSEEEKNALKRQLAKLSKKYQQVTHQQAHTAGIITGAAAMHAEVESAADSSPEPAPAPPVANGRDEDSELELLKMREENQMLMEHVVMVKVRQAEMEGEYLEARRQLARIREKNMQMAKKLADVREAAEKGEPLPFTPRSGAGPMRAATPVADAGEPSQPMRKGLMRIPGL